MTNEELVNKALLTQPVTVIEALATFYHDADNFSRAVALEFFYAMFLEDVRAGRVPGDMGTDRLQWMAGMFGGALKQLGAFAIDFYTEEARWLLAQARKQPPVPEGMKS